MPFEIRPLTELFCAEIVGLDLSAQSPTKASKSWISHLQPHFRFDPLIQ